MLRPRRTVPLQSLSRLAYNKPRIPRHWTSEYSRHAVTPAVTFGQNNTQVETQGWTACLTFWNNGSNKYRKLSVLESAAPIGRSVRKEQATVQQRGVGSAPKCQMVLKRTAKGVNESYAYCYRSRSLHTPFHWFPMANTGRQLARIDFSRV